MNRKYAIINNNIVTDIQILSEEQYMEYSTRNQMLIDIEDELIQPQVNYIFNGNRLEIPVGESAQELFEIALAEKKTLFGFKLAINAVNRIGARNKILNKTGSQVSTLINQLLGIKMLLDTGALGTARASCVQLKSLYTEYSDIFEMVIQEINSFEQSNGL